MSTDANSTNIDNC